jgi:hypothetical protein
MPRYEEFLTDVKSIGRGVLVSSPDEQPKLEANLNEFARQWVEGPSFKARYQNLTEERYVDDLAANSGIALEPAERAAFINKLSNFTMTRAQLLLELVNNRNFIKKEENRSLVLLHYFGYLHRNPDDPPDRNLDGFNFWLKEIETSGDPGRLLNAFMASGENKTRWKE